MIEQDQAAAQAVAAHPLGPLAELAAYPQWIIAALPSKEPADLRTGAHPVSALDPAHWTDYATAAAQAQALSATTGTQYRLGFVLTEHDPFVVIDLDKCLRPTGWDEGALTLIRLLPGAVVELSQSGTGLHIWCKYPNPPAHGNRRAPRPPFAFGLEAYSRDRYIMLGTQANGTLATTCEGLPRILENLFPPASKGRAEVSDDGPCAEWSGPEDDDELIAAMRSWRPGVQAFRDDGVTFSDLFDFNVEKLARRWPSDQSERDGVDRSSADLSLMCRLAFATGRHQARIERIMRRSALARDKWDRGDWLAREIRKACEQTTEVLGQRKGAAKPLTVAAPPSHALAPLQPLTESPEAVREAQRKRAQAIGDGEADAPPVAEVLPLDAMLTDLVLISDGSRVAHRHRPHISLPASEFKTHTAASRLEMAGKTFAVADLWLSHPLRITTHTLTFRPGHPEFTTDPEGAPALNLWQPRVRPPSTADVAPFLEHVAYLVPNEAERERFLSWLAHIEQFPGVLPHTHYLMVTPQTGIGRNWLASLLARVWAGATRLGFDLVGSMKDGFNGPLSRRLLVVVDELKAADTGYGAAHHAQALKAMLTTEHRGINPKYGRQHVEFNCARWLMMSQHHDALPLEHSDRRVIVIDNPTERRSAETYRRLYALLEDADFVNAVGVWLAQRDIRGFNPSEPAPSSSAKKKAIEASTSDAARALITLRDGTAFDVLPAREIDVYLKDCGHNLAAGRALASVYRDAGFVSCDHLVTINGKKTRVVAIRNVEELKTASGLELFMRLPPQPSNRAH